MYTPRYIQYFNLPQIPKDLIDSVVPQTLIDSFNSGNRKYERQVNTYVWSDESNEKINSWGQENICSDMYYAFQLMTGSLPIHKDNGTKIKLNYLIDTGGDNVVTTFYDDDQTTELASYNIPVNKWHLFKADTYHSVSNITPGQIRFSITGRIFS